MEGCSIEHDITNKLERSLIRPFLVPIQVLQRFMETTECDAQDFVKLLAGFLSVKQI
jgi:hypothetical protein